MPWYVPAVAALGADPAASQKGFAYVFAADTGARYVAETNGFLCDMRSKRALPTLHRVVASTWI